MGQVLDAPVPQGYIVCSVRAPHKLAQLEH